jgi:hypothetical protein
MGTLTIGWDNVRKGRRDKPDRIFLYAQDKFGKTEFGAGAPNPIFLDFEDGTAELESVQSFDLRNATVETIHEYLDFLLATPGDRRTLVIDPVDEMEKAIQADICRRAGVDGIEDVDGGYGKGWVRLEEALRRIFRKFDDFREKGIGVVVLAHSHVVTAVNPNGADFRKFEPRMEKRTLGIPKDWADCILFGTFEDQIINADKRGKMGKAVGGRKRVIHTVRSATWDAGNRYGLPARLTLSDDPKQNYAAYEAARASTRASVEKMIPEVDALLTKIDNEDERKAIRAWIESNKENHAAVLAGLNRLRERVEAMQSVAKNEPKTKKEVA